MPKDVWFIMRQQIDEWLAGLGAYNADVCFQNIFVEYVSTSCIWKAPAVGSVLQRFVLAGRHVAVLSSM